MDTSHPSDHNQIANALTDIVNELGADPSGASATVQARIEAIEANGWVTAARILAGAVDNSKLATGAGQPGGAWTAFTPSFVGTWAQGNGVWDCAYTRIGKTVIARFKFTIGSTTTKGGGRFQCTPPIDANGGLIAFFSSGAGFPLQANFDAANTIGLYAVDASGAYAQFVNTSATVPKTWATNDIITFTLIYEGI